MALLHKRMSLRVQSIEMKLKQLGLVTLLVGGLCVSAFAQTSSLSLPSLPSIPSAAPTSNVNAPSAPSVNVPQAPVAPSAPQPASLTLQPGSATANANQNNVETVANDNSPVNAMPPVAPTKAVAPEAKEIAKISHTNPAAVTAATGSNPTLGALPAIGTLPNLPLPPSTAAGTITPPPMLDIAPTSLPEVHVNSEKKQVKTWLTKLEPTVVIPKTNFNYKREILPDAIYRDSYNAENSHLPKRVTREDYENLLFASAARNDVEATRALLNAGTGLGVTNADGETPLMVAERSGAIDVAALLTARGAK